MMKNIFCLVLAALVMSGCNYAAVDSANVAERGIKLYESGNLNKAMSVLQSAVDRDPNNDIALYWMARIDMDYHDYQAAIPRLNEATGIYPGQPLYWFTLAQAHAQQAEQQFLDNQKDASVVSYGECVKAAEKASKLDPFYAEAQLQAARCHVGAEEYNDAVDSYAQAIESNPTMKSPQGVTEHYVELGKLYTRFGFYREAESVLDDGLLHNAGDGQMESAMGDVLFDMKNYTGALAHYEMAYKFLDNSGSMLRALDAMYGAGAASFELALVQKEKAQIREYSEKLEVAKKWFERYAEHATVDSEKLRRATALAKISEIDNILDELNI